MNHLQIIIHLRTPHARAAFKSRTADDFEQTPVWLDDVEDLVMARPTDDGDIVVIDAPTDVEFHALPPTKIRLVGRDAIDAFKTLDGLFTDGLCKLADPLEDARDGLTLDQATAVADEDAELIYLDVDIDETLRMPQSKARLLAWLPLFVPAFRRVGGSESPEGCWPCEDPDTLREALASYGLRHLGLVDDREAARPVEAPTSLTTYLASLRMETAAPTAPTAPTASTIPITIDQFRAALSPDAFVDHQVTEWDVELMGLTYSNPEAKPRFFAWMMANGWQPRQEASGNILWSRPSQSIWLDDLVEYAAAYMVRCLRGDDSVTPGDAVTPADERPGLEILAEIIGTEITPDAVTTSKSWDGGGLLRVWT